MTNVLDTIKKRILKREVRAVLSKITVYAIGGYLVGEPLLEFLRNVVNGTLNNMWFEFVQMLKHDYRSLVIGVFIIFAGLYVFDVK